MTSSSAQVVLAILLMCFTAPGLPGGERAGTEKAAALRSASAAEWLAGPVAGFLTDEAAVQVRPILGVPGAAIAGEPLTLPEGVSKIRIAPGHRYAILEFSGAALPAILNLEKGGEPRQIAGILMGCDILSFSPEGRSAAFYSVADRRLQVLTNLPNEPRMTRELDVAEAARVAVSDDGEWLLIASSTGSVSVVAPDGTAAPAFRASTAPLLSFLPRRPAAAICDTERGEILLLTGLEDNLSARLAATGLSGASGIAASADGGSIVAVAAETATGWRVDLTSGAVHAFALPAGPQFIESMRVPDSFLISSRAGEPAWLLIAREFETRAYFVPAVTAPAVEAEQ